MNAEEEYINSLSHLDYLREQNKTDSNVKRITNLIVGKERTISSLEKRESVQQYIQLLEDKFVQNYIHAKEELNDLEYDRHKERKKLQLLKQQLCTHPAILVTEELKTYESLSDDQIGQGIIPKEDIITYGICLVCNKRMNPVDRESTRMDCLVYIKDRSDNYFLKHEDVVEAQNKFDSLRKGKKCSYKDLSKRLVKRKGVQHEQDENTGRIKG